MYSDGRLHQLILRRRSQRLSRCSRGVFSRPLHVQRVDFVRANVAGQYRRAVGGYTDCGVATRAGSADQTLQTGNRLDLAEACSEFDTAFGDMDSIEGGDEAFRMERTSIF